MRAEVVTKLLPRDPVAVGLSVLVCILPVQSCSLQLTRNIHDFLPVIALSDIELSLHCFEPIVCLQRVAGVGKLGWVALQEFAPPIPGRLVVLLVLLILLVVLILLHHGHHLGHLLQDLSLYAQHVFQCRRWWRWWRVLSSSSSDHLSLTYHSLLTYQCSQLFCQIQRRTDKIRNS